MGWPSSFIFVDDPWLLKLNDFKSGVVAEKEFEMDSCGNFVDFHEHGSNLVMGSFLDAPLSTLLDLFGILAS